MIQLTLDIDDIDFDGLVDQFLPQMTDKLRQSKNPVALLLSNGMSASLAKGVLKSLSKEKKEKLAAELIEQNGVIIGEQLEKFAAGQNIRLKVRRVRADAV